ncbi:MAG: arsenate reductase family protein [Bacteriovoracia bacterium]
MSQIKVYGYEKCSTCRKAYGFLEKKKVSFEKIPIVDQPPTLSELRAMLNETGDVRKLFNTSGQMYREMKLGDKLKTMSEGEALKLLSQHGKLVKRPFVVGSGHRAKGLVGFKEDLWKKAFS